MSTNNQPESASAPAELPGIGESRKIFIAGGAGRIESLIAAPRESAAIRGICVVCHPHPLYGGSMTHKVVYTLASAAMATGLMTARFNFRGVGHSDGSFDNADGETEDALAVLAWLRARLPQAPLLLAGFSFGAYVSLKAAARARPAALISVSIPFGRYVDATEPPPQPACPWLALHSVDDEIVDFAESQTVLNGYARPPEFIRFDGAGHFFHGRLGDLRAAVLPFMEQHFGG